MKFPRRNRTTKPPIVLELAGLNALPTIPSRLTINHVIERKPTAPPTRVRAVGLNRNGYPFVGNDYVLNSYPHRVRLQLPPSAQVGMKDPESGQYIPLDSIELEFQWSY